MSSWTSYPSIFAMGHRVLKGLLDVDVNVEEKVDGSQFSFGLLPSSPADLVHCTIDNVDHSLKVRSKGAVMHVDAPQKMFAPAVDTVKALAPLLHPGWTYRGEAVCKPKHNALLYDRVPKGCVILYDVNVDDQGFLSYEEKVAEANRLGLEVVPLLFTGRINSVEEFRAFLESVSILGGQKIEGVVVKPTLYNLYGTDKKVIFGKFVSEAFKEVHRKAWGEANPTNKDIITQVADRYTSKARWNKAIQHLREAGTLTDSPKDIGPLIKEIPEDIYRECAEEIKEELFKYAWQHIRRSVTRGFPEYYKELLLAKSFEANGPIDNSPERVEEREPDVDSYSAVDRPLSLPFVV